MTLAGYDVSMAQVPDQTQGADFVLAKAGEGESWHDPEYAAHMAAAQARSQLFGAYWLTWPVFDPVICAQNSVEAAGLSAGDLFMHDFEPLTVKAKMAKYGEWDPTKWPAWICAYNAEVANLLQRPVLQYFNDWHASLVFKYATPAQAAMIWRSLLVKAGTSNHYVSSPTTDPGDLHGWSRATVFQWTDGSTINPPERIDHDVFFGSAGDWRAFGGVSGKDTKSVTYRTACGYTALTSFPASFVAPNGHVTSCRNNDWATIAARLCWRLATEAVPGFAVSRGGSTIQEQIDIYRQLGLPPVFTSNHLCGLAFDGGNGRQVFEPNQTGPYYSGYTPAQENLIDVILASAEFGGILEWGHHFDSPRRDPVHYQIRQMYPRGAGPYPVVVSRAQIAAVASGIRAFTKRVQTSVGVTPDGLAGPGTIAAVKKFQRQHNLTDDGVVGPATQDAMGWNDPPPPGTLKDDGDFGHESVKALQVQLGMKTTDGTFSSQPSSRADLLPGVSAVKYVPFHDARGSRTVSNLQSRVGIKDTTGMFSKPTIRIIQKFLRENGFPTASSDGIWDKPMSVRMQRAINRGVFQKKD